MQKTKQELSGSKASCHAFEQHRKYKNLSANNPSPKLQTAHNKQHTFDTVSSSFTSSPTSKSIHCKRRAKTTWTSMRSIAGETISSQELHHYFACSISRNLFSLASVENPFNARKDSSALLISHSNSNRQLRFEVVALYVYFNNKNWNMLCDITSGNDQWSGESCEQ